MEKFTLRTPREDWDNAVGANSGDPYSRGVVEYAARWASLMEKQIADGGILEAFAKQTSRDANTDGVTGFMYGCAVSMLVHFWVHGEALRQWHNLDCNPDSGVTANETEGAVINPAVFEVGVND